jgi:hypothetical protein
MKYIKYKFTLLLAIIAISGCKKYLSKTPDISLTTPSTPYDFQSMLEEDFMYRTIGAFAPALASDNYYLDYPTWQSWRINYRNSYIWASDIYQGTPSYLADWGILYKIIYTCNIVLDGLKSLKRTTDNNISYDFSRGMALFYRSYAFWELAQVYAKPYEKSTAESDLGIPLRLKSDLNTKSTRASVGTTYKQIIKDLKASVVLLPSTIQTNHLNHPSKPVVYALLARTYLSMKDYQNAGLYADSSLMYYHTLINYNSIDTTSSDPFTSTNAETMFQSYINWGVPVLGTDYTSKLIDTVLYNSYSANDLRKTIYFSTNNEGKPYYSGSYTGSIFLFNGFATDEMYLTRAESEARDGKTSLAMTDLNTLLVKRWKTGKFIPYTASNPKEALKVILQERRKELLGRGLRWTDLRRLNMEPGFETTLIRILNGKQYSLPPNDPRYVYPIPEDEIKLSHLQQNKR